MTAHDDFFVGYDDQSVARAGRSLRLPVLALLVAIVGLAAGFTAWQSTVRDAWFDFGDVQEYHGVLVAEPVPMLVRDRVAAGDGPSVLLLVNEWKFGFDAEQARAWHLHPVRLQGTLIHDDQGQAMIEVAAGSVATTGNAALARDAVLPPVERLGEVTLRGEIVDSKCYLGVMNPGVLKPHRACAIRCIAGGIPPILLVRGADGQPPRHYLLVGADGEAIGTELLDLVAMPVEVTGGLERLGELHVLRAPPSAFQAL